VPIPPHIAYLRERVGQITLLTPAAAAVIRDERGHVLLIRRGDGRGWSLNADYLSQRGSGTSGERDVRVPRSRWQAARRWRGVVGGCIFRP